MTGSNIDSQSQNADLVQVGQQIVTAIAALNKTVSTVFPQGELITNSAGSASGNYLTVIGNDGNTYKLNLLLPS